MSRDKLAIIIPVYNESQFIIKTLSSFLKQNVAFKDFQLVIVDNNSSDDSLNKVNNFTRQHPKLNAVLLSEDRQGPRYARKKGLDWASQKRYSYLSGTDADCQAPRDFVSSMLINLRNKRIDAVAGKEIWPPITLVGLEGKTKNLLRKRKLLENIIKDFFGPDFSGVHYGMTLETYRAIKGWPIKSAKGQLWSDDDLYASRLITYLGKKIVVSSNRVIHSNRRLQGELIKYVSELSHKGKMKSWRLSDQNPIKNLSKKEIEKAWKSSLKEFGKRALWYYADLLLENFGIEINQLTRKRILEKFSEFFLKKNFQKIDKKTLKHQKDPYVFLEEKTLVSITFKLNQMVKKKLRLDEGIG